MNQNCNNNGYEVLDSGKEYCQPRYPFAQVSGSELRNMGYKEWMNMCTSGDPTVLREGYSADVRDAVITSINIASYLLSVPFPPAGAAAGILGALLGLLWPTKNTQAVWESFMNAVEVLINQAIDRYVRAKAIAELAGLQNVLELYQEAANDWNKNPDSQQNKNRVLDEFRGANRHFETSMPSFAVRAFEVNLLPVYAEAANLHLLLLRDAVKFGKEWGMSSVPGEEWDDMYRRLRSRTATYTDYCVNTYNQGLQQARNLQANVSDYSRYPWTQYNQSGGTPVRRRDARGEYQGTENWNLYNAYRRDLTIMALDIITLFPTYDPGLYSTPVKSELTREVYTDIRGTTWRSNATFNTIDGIENRMLGNRQSQLFTWLTGMNLYIRYTGKSTNFTHGDLMVGLEKKVRKTNASDQWLPVEGQKTHYTRVDRPGIEFGEYYWYYARTQQWFETRLLQLWVNTGTLSLNAGTIGVGGEFWQRDLPQYKDIYARSTRDHSIENHRLSWIKFEPVRDDCPFAWPEYKQLSALLFGWTHNSVDLFNTIASGRITQIPAVKAFGLIPYNSDTKVIKGPGSTGGDLIQLSSGYLKYAFPLTQNRSYRIRIRYASTSGSILMLRRWIGNGVSDSSHNLPATYSGGPLNYNTFAVFDTGRIIQTTSNFELWLDNIGNGTLIIDKIEFIPLNPVPEPPVPEGIYQIVTALNNSSVIDMDPSTKNVHLWGNGNANNQKWRFVYNSSQGAYQIKNIADENLVLTWQRAEGNNVKAVSNASLPEQYWIIQNTENGYVYVTNKADQSKVLDVGNSNTANGMNILVWNNNGGTNQKFKLVKLS